MYFVYDFFRYKFLMFPNGNAKQADFQKLIQKKKKIIKSRNNSFRKQIFFLPIRT